MTARWHFVQQLERVPGLERRHEFPPGDPRMMTFIITSPADLSGKSGSKPDIPIQLFATFYVTVRTG